MFRFERSFDYPLIRSIIGNPRVYRVSVDDFAPPLADFQLIESDCIWYVLIYWDGELIGLFALAAQSAICFELHHSLLPGKWLPQGKEALQQFLPWAFTRVRLLPEVPIRRLVAPVPLKFRTQAANEIALNFLRDVGFQEWGRNPKAFQKHGRLVDLVWLGIGVDARGVIGGLDFTSVPDTRVI